MVKEREISQRSSELVTEYLRLPTDNDRLRMWENSTFVVSFPEITRKIVKKEISISSDEIKTIVSSGLSALNNLSWSSRITEEGFLPSREYNFYRDGAVNSIGSLPRDGVLRDSLSTANLACLFLLGMKVMRDDKELSREVGKYSHLLKKQRFTHRLFALLSKNNAVRGWIIDNELESQWDSRLATLLCNLHTQSLKEPIKFPAIVSSVDAAKSYSQNTIFVILKYVAFLLQYAKKNGKELSREAATQIMDFHYTLTNMPSNFREKEKVREHLKSINDVLGTNYQI